MKLFFPDLNVWLALAYSGHQHHASAAKWFADLGRRQAYFCRITQLGFLRLLTHSSVMGEDVRTQSEAWAAYDLFLNDERIVFFSEPEPQQLEKIFRNMTSAPRSHAKQWSDAYLAAFARVCGLVLVTFDRALWQSERDGSLLLQ